MLRRCTDCSGQNVARCCCVALFISTHLVTVVIPPLMQPKCKPMPDYLLKRQLNLQLLKRHAVLTWSWKSTNSSQQYHNSLLSTSAANLDIYENSHVSIKSSSAEGKIKRDEMHHKQRIRCHIIYPWPSINRRQFCVQGTYHMRRYCSCWTWANYRKHGKWRTKKIFRKESWKKGLDCGRTIER